MPMIRITKIFRFETAHALAGYDGLCRHIHGHSYELQVTIKGEPIADHNSPKMGMVMDFGDLKRLVRRLIVDRYDHALVLSEESRHLIPEHNADLFGKVLIVPWQPSSEGFLGDFARVLRAELPEGVTLHHMLLRETPSSFAEWYAEDNQ